MDVMAGILVVPGIGSHSKFALPVRRFAIVAKPGASCGDWKSYRWRRG